MQINLPSYSQAELLDAHVHQLIAEIAVFSPQLAASMRVVWDDAVPDGLLNVNLLNGDFDRAMEELDHIRLMHDFAKESL